MKLFVVGGGTLLGAAGAARRAVCSQCGLVFADEEPCFVCGQPVCRHCAHHLDALGHCCSRHGNVAFALSKEYAVQTRMLARGRRKPAPSPAAAAGSGLQWLSTPYYRCKDDAERALRFIAAMKGISLVRNVEFLRELGCEGSARFHVWQALGLVEQEADPACPAEPAGPWTPGTVPRDGGRGAAAGFLR